MQAGGLFLITPADRWVDGASLKAFLLVVSHVRAQRAVWQFLLTALPGPAPEGEAGRARCGDSGSPGETRPLASLLDPAEDGPRSLEACSAPSGPPLPDALS